MGPNKTSVHLLRQGPESTRPTLNPPICPRTTRGVQTKPVIASMADVAASGGYYMAMACNKIVAEPLTITGSIGVVTGAPMTIRGCRRALDDGTCPTLEQRLQLLLF